VTEPGARPPLVSNDGTTNGARRMSNIYLLHTAAIGPPPAKTQDNSRRLEPESASVDMAGPSRTLTTPPSEQHPTTIDHTRQGQTAVDTGKVSLGSRRLLKPHVSLGGKPPTGMFKTRNPWSPRQMSGLARRKRIPRPHPGPHQSLPHFTLPSAVAALYEPSWPPVVGYILVNRRNLA
jgi:hypothetical protein